MTAAEFIVGMYCDACTYDAPQPITEADAAYNIREYRADGIPIPPFVTPRLFAKVWNTLYERDIARGASDCAT